MRSNGPPSSSDQARCAAKVVLPWPPRPKMPTRHALSVTSHWDSWVSSAWRPEHTGCLGNCVQSTWGRAPAPARRGVGITAGRVERGTGKWGARLALVGDNWPLSWWLLACMTGGPANVPALIWLYRVVVSSMGSTPNSAARTVRQVSYWANAAARCPLYASSSIWYWWAVSRHVSRASSRLVVASPRV